MSDPGFPETPKGSPGDIEAAAGYLENAAELVETSGSSLHQTASGLSGVAWSGQAQARFTAAAAGLSTVSRGAEETVTEDARAVRAYAEALATAQRVIDRAPEAYERAKAAEASAGALAGRLSNSLAGAEPGERRELGDRLRGASADMEVAGDDAHAALVRAQEARADFDRAQRETIGVLEGTAPAGTMGLGSPAAPFGGAAGAGGFGAFGGGFGIPMGGLETTTAPPSTRWTTSTASRTARGSTSTARPRSRI